MSVLDINPDNINDKLIRERHLWAVVKWSLYRQYDRNFRNRGPLSWFMVTTMTQINHGMSMEYFTLEDLVKNGVLVIDWATYVNMDNLSEDVPILFV